MAGFRTWPLIGAAMLAAPAAAQLTAPDDPSGSYMLATTFNGADCPQGYPNTQVILARVSRNEVALTMQGQTTTMLYQPDRQSLSGLMPSFYGYGPVALSGTVDYYQGQTTLDLNIRWTGIDCMAGATGGLEGQTPPAAAEAPADTTVPPATVIGPAASEKAKRAPDGETASVAAPGTTSAWLREMPFAIKFALVAFAAILLGWMLGKWLARRSG